MKKVVILLPTYNEKKNLEKFIIEVFSQEKNASGWAFEILVVDSHSPDGTFELAEQLAKKNHKIHVLEVGRGLGVALIEGHWYSLEHFKPDALAQMDADGQVGAEVLPRMLETLDEGYDLALGSRFVAGGKNKLSFMRQVFTWGSCLVSRVIMGPLDIGEFTNSARAFTPELFKKVDLTNVPWRENTFIIQPAFLNAAIEAGARYKEVPLIFKNRAEGYSKNKTVNYTFDVITYAIDARLHKWGLNIPFFGLSHKLTTFLKFGVVGVTGTVVDFAFYSFFINQFGFAPGLAKVFSGEAGVVNNFTWNNMWTFKHRQTSSGPVKRFLVFNLVSFGGIAIGALVVNWLHSTYGEGTFSFMGLKMAYTTLYFFATIPPVMAWNFTVNSMITWRNQS